MQYDMELVVLGSWGGYIKTPATRPVGSHEKWRCPPSGKLKLNFDASVNLTLGYVQKVQL
ncbi:LOW QUALITY PROTEIN: hypothetical protein TorRG33x02_313040 [Trema orientale]|uniref:Uncharacterized protein n=1 Tax=Trema orientale TaxID=63057 RepID=A0A2P5BPP6_TREOI|nr:LOW QUALITY PROTEIN: hypothetical protein TorRG33x02_313040 [Trema orientale]